MKLDYICKFCGKVCAKPSGLAIHERTCKLNPERKPIQNHKCNWPGAKSRVDGWICRGCLYKFKTRKELFSHQKECNSYKELLINECKERGKAFSKKFKGSKILSHQHTDEYKQRMRELAFERQLGGWHTSKTIDYKRY